MAAHSISASCLHTYIINITINSHVSCVSSILISTLSGTPQIYQFNKNVGVGVNAATSAFMYKAYAYEYSLQIDSLKRDIVSP